MQRFGVFSTQSWYLNLSPWQRDLVRIGLELYAREERMKSGYDDYSYVVFPIAKAYEGFLKQYFYDLGFIDYMTYSDRRFRIGRVLNPDVSPSRQDEFWMYGRLAQMCGAGLARGLWVSGCSVETKSSIITQIINGSWHSVKQATILRCLLLQWSRRINVKLRILNK